MKHGYKVFDLRRQVVVRVFPPATCLAKVRRQIAWVLCVGAHCFAPTVGRWNIEERWYEEDSVNGFPGVVSDWTRFLHSLQDSITVLARLIFAFSPREIWALEYVQGRSEFLLGGRSVLSDAGLNAVKVATIRRFVEAIVDRLYLAGDRPISLVCSHGDCLLGHVLATKHGTVLIDWEAVASRSALCDLYHVFFRRLSGGGAAPGITAEMAKAISQLQSHEALHVPADMSSLVSFSAATEIYRCIYYIERICKYVETRPEMNEANLNEALLFTHIYHAYEEQLRDDTRQSCAV